MLTRQQLIHYAHWHGAQKAQALQYQQVYNVIHQQVELATGRMQAALLDLDGLFATLSQRYPLSYVQEMVVLRARMLSPYASTEEMRSMYQWVIEQLAPLPAVGEHPLPPVAAPSCQPQPHRSRGSRGFWVIVVEKAEGNMPCMRIRARTTIAEFLGQFHP